MCRQFNRREIGTNWASFNHHFYVCSRTTTAVIALDENNYFGNRNYFGDDFTARRINFTCWYKGGQGKLFAARKLLNEGEDIN